MDGHTTDFFDLPRELRDLVYHFLWYDYPDIATSYRDKQSRVRYRPTTSPSAKQRIHRKRTGLPAWLFINKAFLEEAIATFNARAEWTLLSFWRITPGAGSAPLFSLSKAQIVTLMLGDLAPITRFLSQGSIAHCCRELIGDHHRIADDMLASDKAQDLHIWLELAEDADGDTFEDIAGIDVEFLEPFQHVPLRDVVIYVDDEDGILNMDEARQNNVYTGFRRMGRAVLGSQHEGRYTEKD